MDRHRGRRQVVIGAFVPAVALLLTGFALGIAEMDAEGSIFDSDHGSVDAFKKQCIANVGTFLVTRWGTECHFSNGTFFRCDANGNDCVVSVLGGSEAKKQVEHAEPAEVEADPDGGVDVGGGPGPDGDGNVGGGGTVSAEPEFDSDGDIVAFGTNDDGADRFRDVP